MHSVVSLARPVAFTPSFDDNESTKPGCCDESCEDIVSLSLAGVGIGATTLGAIAFIALAILTQFPVIPAFIFTAVLITGGVFVVLGISSLISAIILHSSNHSPSSSYSSWDVLTRRDSLTPVRRTVWDHERRMREVHEDLSRTARSREHVVT